MAQKLTGMLLYIFWNSDRIFDQIFGQVFDQVFGQGFYQVLGEGNKTINTVYGTTGKEKYSVQYYSDGKIYYTVLSLKKV